MKSKILKKIVWAVDVLEEPKSQKNILFALGAMARPTEASIEPVYVLSPPYAQANLEAPTDIEQAFYALAEKRLLELKKGRELTTIAAGKILINHSDSTRRSVEALANYAESVDADLIVTATNARRGLARAFLGSFAETLALYSKIPIVTVNPEMKIRERISTILLPTTFQEKFRPPFEQVVKFAKALDASLTLFYKVPLVPGHYLYPEVLRYLSEQLSERKKTAKEWQAWATDYGVPTDVILDEIPGEGRGIQELASEKNFDLIAVPSQANAFSAVLAGSMARTLMRHAPCPVWVMRVDSGE